MQNDLFHSALSRTELSNMVYDLLKAHGIENDRAWDRADELERQGRAACVREIEDLRAGL